MENTRSRNEAFHIAKGTLGPLQIFAIISILFMMGAIAAITEPASTEERPLPFDPLDPWEQQLAGQTVMSDEELTATLSDRHNVLGAALHTNKSFRDAGEWPRIALVWVYDYDHNRAIRAYVDLQAPSVVQWDVRNVQPPASVKEVAAAGEKTLADDDVQNRLLGYGINPGDVEWTGRLWTGTGATACPENRCLLVAFLQEGEMVQEFTVLVDLVEDRAQGVLGPHGMPLDESGGGVVL